jgi:nucleoside-diphosphate-sugar epimerase
MRAAFPGFNYELVDDPALCTIGRTSSPSRSPMNIERIQADFGYQPAYLPDAAFSDFLKWGKAYPADTQYRA